MKRILISQNTPSNLTPYTSIEEKYGVKFDFFPFFKIEPLTSMEFRTQRVNIADYTAVVFSSRFAIDAYFKLSEELRFKVPETMKYFCSTELVAMYLQKHIVYRKRKIFYGDGSVESILALITGKHAGEKFLMTAADSANAQHALTLFQDAGIDVSAANFVKSVPQDLRGIDLHSYDMVVLYNKADVASIFASYPDFKQDNLKIASYGKGVVNAITEAGLSIELQAPTPEAPSVAKALDLYLASHK
ncbi:MAG: uroporphyrinogen-III synthase [Bacteroidales bacterium]|nr:uroporphyrinogen-III synthase [Bacteroidales bacterium]